MKRVPPPWLDTEFEPLLRKLKPRPGRWTSNPDQWFNHVYGAVRAIGRDATEPRGPGLPGLLQCARKELAKRRSDLDNFDDLSTDPNEQRLLQAKGTSLRAEVDEWEGIVSDLREANAGWRSDCGGAPNRRPGLPDASIRDLLRLVRWVCVRPHYETIAALLTMAGRPTKHAWLQKIGRVRKEISDR